MHAAGIVQRVWRLRCHKVWEKQFDRQQQGAWSQDSARHAKVGYYVDMIASWQVHKLPVELLTQLKACFYRVRRQQLQPVCRNMTMSLALSDAAWKICCELN